MKQPIFITGNPGKADVLERFLGIPLEHMAVDQQEVQGTLAEVVEYKARQAYQTLGKAVLVEDVSVACEALGGLPGVYIKHYLNPPEVASMTVSPAEMICRMLDGFSNRRAQARCMYGYFDGNDVAYIEGSITGEIADHPRGENGFGWDPIFVPDGFGGKTRAELTPSDDPQTYPSVRPWQELRTFLMED